MVFIEKSGKIIPPLSGSMIINENALFRLDKAYGINVFFLLSLESGSKAFTANKL